MEREISAIIKKCLRILKHVKIDGERSKEFEVKVAVHHGLIFRPLLFAVMMDELQRT